MDPSVKCWALIGARDMDGKCRECLIGDIWHCVREGTFSTVRGFLYPFQALWIAAESSRRLIVLPKARRWQLAWSFSAQPTHTAGSAFALTGVTPWLAQLLIGITHYTRLLLVVKGNDPEETQPRLVYSDRKPSNVLRKVVALRFYPPFSKTQSQSFREGHQWHKHIYT